VKKCQKEQIIKARSLQECCKDEKLWRKCHYTLKTGTKGNFIKIEMQDDKQCNGSICLKFKRRKSENDKEKILCFDSTPS